MKQHNGYFKRARMPGQVHLSLSQTRALSAEMPIGDPLGGAAYGRMDMPVAVVALAAGSFAAGASAFAAATTLVGMVSAGALMVGSALTIAGTVTGNQKLAKIGGIISLVGGIGGLADNLINGAASAAGDAASGAATSAATDVTGNAIADAASSAAGSVADTVTGLAAPAGDLATGAGSVLEGASNAASGLAAPVSSSVADAAGTALGQAGADAATQAAGQVTQSAASPFVTSGGAFTPDAASAFAAPTSGNGLLGGLESYDLSSSFNPAVTGQNTGLMGYFDKAGQWVKSNPQTAKILTDTVGGIASNLSPSAAQKAQTARLSQQTEEARIRQLWRQGKIA